MISSSSVHVRGRHIALQDPPPRPLRLQSLIGRDFPVELAEMAVGPADKGHSPFPSSERAIYGFALYLGSYLLLGIHHFNTCINFDRYNIILQIMMVSLASSPWGTSL